MASDVENLSTFYTDLPSIFESNSSSPVESTPQIVVHDVNKDKSYQPMLNSFLFADSDPLNRAAFVTQSPSIEPETRRRQQQQSPPMDVSESDEDDFDGIPIRHSIKPNRENDLDDELFLNDFNDEQQQQEEETNEMVSCLFNNIPDIDDLNEHDEQQVPFDRMDLSDRSESIRSTSPDSLLSSSNSQDDNEDEDADQEVAQWNDDLIMNTTHSQVNSLVNVNLNPIDQVDFIDTSRSNSRCSNNSFHLTIGYADQAQQFLSDDGDLLTSSESEDDDDDNLVLNLTNDLSENEDDDNGICLQINLDNNRADSPISHSISTRSSSPIPDQTPILDMDEENPIEIAPMAALDDEEEEEDEDVEAIDTYPNLPLFIPEQPVLADLRSNLKSLIQFQHNHHQNELVHDIIQMRHLFNENNHDDEFLAIMHNPTIFEEVLSVDDNEKRSEPVKQTNSVISTFRPSIHLSNDNEIENDSFEQQPNTHQTSLVSDTNKNMIDVNHHFDIICQQNTMNDFSDADDDNDFELLQTLSQIHNVTSNEMELFNKTTRTQTSSCVNDRVKQSDEEQEEKNEKNNIIFYKNHNDVEEKKEKKTGERNNNNNDDGDDQEEKNATTRLPLIISSPIFSHDDSLSSYDRETSSSSSPSLTNLLSLNHRNESTTFVNQLNTDDLQISNANTNMTHHLSDEQQISTTNLFDPFDPLTTTTTTTTVNMFNNENSNRTLANYDFDDLWNQSMSQVESSNLTWESLFDDKPQPNDDLRNYLHWLFQHIHESLPDIQFTSTQNLESIVKDIQMSALPFEPIPSPPLHIDHTVANPLINAIQHQLFPIDELEQPPISTPQSMILYEVDENVDDEEQIQSIVEKLVSDTLEKAVTEVNQPTNFVENFIDRILSDAVCEIYEEEQAQQQSPPVENLASILGWHDQSKATDKQLPDPFDQQFDTVWSQHFQAPDDTIIENIFEEEKQQQQQQEIVNDPWLLPSDTIQTNDSILSFENHNNDDHFLKYSITAPVFDDTIEEAILKPETNSNENEIKHDEVIEQTEIDSITQVESSPTPPPELKSTWSTAAVDNEPWELEDQVPTATTNLNNIIDDDDDLSPVSKVNSHGNFFSDSFQPINESEQMKNKFVRFDENVENIEIVNPPSNDESSSDLDIEDITTNIPNQNNERMEMSYVTIEEKDIEVERPYEMIESIAQINENQQLTSTINENIPIESPPQIQNSFSNESVLLRSVSNEEPNIDPDEINGVITCFIDNTQINIDAKSINPFKCVISSAGTLNGDNQTVVITIYGCALPDHRLREYRYIMDQLFYYVYHKLNNLVINDYILIYFHGATSKHRTPDLKFLRKCYQMINFRLRKNLRSVYVVHPTRWLRTVIALSRPFFSKKFYHKIHYIYTIAELERQFPNNRLSIPTAIEQRMN